MNLKNADNRKFPITKLNPWKLAFRKQPIITGDEIKVNVILATKYKVKAKNFIIPIFYFPVSFLLYIVCGKTSTFSFFIIIAFLFEDCFKASKEQVTINKLYIKFDVLVLQRYSAASNSKETSGGTLKLNFSPNWTKPITLSFQGQLSSFWLCYKRVALSWN